jgi:predicted small metal-binding protein
MKQLTCAQMGGPETCSAVISGNSAEEMVTNGMKHLEETHPEMAADMKNMPKEAMDKWMATFQEKWAATPDSN